MGGRGVDRVLTEGCKCALEMGEDTEDPVFTRSFCLEISIRIGQMRHNNTESVNGPHSERL